MARNRPELTDDLQAARGLAETYYNNPHNDEPEIPHPRFCSPEQQRLDYLNSEFGIRNSELGIKR